MSFRPPVFPTLRKAAPRRDLLAALTLAAIALPSQLATAALAGQPATQGLVVFAVSALTLLVVSREGVLSVGADSSIAPLIAAALAVGAMPGDAALLAGMVGSLLVSGWILRLEWIGDLLSRAVSAGMLAGIAVHILIGRLPTALGLPIPVSEPLPLLAALFGQLGDMHWPPLVMAAGVALAALAGRQFAPRFPTALLALMLAVGVAVLADPSGQVFPRIAGVTGGPGLVFPDPEAARMVALLPAALAIAFLCLSQTTIVLRAAGHDGANRRRNAIGSVGLANLASAAVGGFAVNASPPSTRVLIDSGAQSQLAGTGAALLGLALLGLGTGLIAELPAAALAGVLIHIAIHLLRNAALPDLIRRSPTEGAIAIATVLLVVALPLNVGLPLAMLLSLVYAALPLFQSNVVELHNVPGTGIWWHEPKGAPGHHGEDVLVLGLTSPISFANAAGVIAGITARIAAQPRPPRLVVLECAGVLAVDLAGADRLIALIGDLRKKGIDIAMARLESLHAQRDLDRSGVLAALGHDRLFESVDQAVRALNG